MKLLINIALYAVVVVLVFQNFLLLALVGLAVSAYRFTMAWFIPMAILIDGYFGAFYTIPKISITVVLLYVVSELLRTRMLIQSDYEKEA